MANRCWRTSPPSCVSLLIDFESLICKKRTHSGRRLGDRLAMVSPCSGCLHKVAEISPISLSLFFRRFRCGTKSRKIAGSKRNFRNALNILRIFNKSCLIRQRVMRAREPYLGRFVLSRSRPFLQNRRFSKQSRKTDAPESKTKFHNTITREIILNFLQATRQQIVYRKSLLHSIHILAVVETCWMCV